MNCLRVEPSLSDVLSDPIVRALMTADGVDPQALEAELCKAALRAKQSAEADSRVASSASLPSSPFQKDRTVSRNLSFHSAQPGGKPPTW